MRVVALVLLVVALALGIATNVAAKNIHVAMHAKWPETSFVAEVCEGISKQQSGLFFDCFNAAASIVRTLPNGTVSFHTPQDHYNVAMEIIQQLSLPGTVAALIQTELALRVFSPSVQAHRQLSSQHKASCYPFLVTADGSVACSVEEALRNADSLNPEAPAATAAAEYSDVDHVYPGSPSSDNAKRIFLYGSIGDGATMSMHQALVSEVQSKAVRYIFRHADGTSLVTQGHSSVEHIWEQPLSIPAYGVTLDVKNMEYKAVDDKKPADAKRAKEDLQQQTNVKDDDEAIGGFDIAKLKQRKPSLVNGLNDFASELAEQLGKDQEEVKVDLQVWELQQLGFQTALHVLKSKNPMEVLEDVLNNFPLRAGKVSKLTFGNQLRVLQQQLAPLQRMFGEGTNVAYLNGRAIADERLDAFSILSEIRKDESYLQDLERVMLYSGKYNETIEPSSQEELMYYLNRAKGCQLQKQADRREKPKRFWLEQSRIHWLNDLRTDPMFADAGTSVRDMLRSNYYGQPLFPKKNIFHAVFLIDPSFREGLDAISNIGRMLMQGTAIRIGISFLDKSFSPYDERHHYATAFSVDGSMAEVPEDAAVIKPTVSAMIQAAALELYNDSPMKMLELLVELYRNARKDELSEELVRENTTSLLKTHGLRSLDEILASPQFYEHYRDQNRYLKSVGIKNVPVALFNGLLFSENIHNAVYMGFQQEFGLVRDMVLRGELDDTQEDVYDFVMRVNNAIRRYQPAIYDRVSYVPLKSKNSAAVLETRPFARAKNFDGQTSLLTHLLVLPLPLTMEGVRMLDRGIQHMEQCEVCVGIQLTFVTCDDGAQGRYQRSPIERLLEGTLLQLQAEVDSTRKLIALRSLLDVITQYVETTFTPREIRRLVFTENVIDGLMTHLKGNDALPVAVKQALYNANSFGERQEALVEGFCHDLRRGDSRHVGKSPLIITNGRKTLFDDSFLAEDFGLLEFEEAPRAQTVWNCLETVDQASLLAKRLAADDVTKHFISTKLAMVGSILFDDHTTRGPRMEKFYLPYPNTPYSFSLNVPKTNGMVAARHTFNAVLNPVSRESQQLASLLRYFNSIEKLSVSTVVFLNPPLEMQKIPIHNFYQLVAPTAGRFDGSGAVLSPSAYFKNVPTSVTLTLGLVEPEAWMVFASTAAQDLDNIRLNTLHGATLHAEYTLESILVTGSAHDMTSDSRPRGLPIVMTNRPGLLTQADGAKDTLVMSNYGYFQLQGAPGVWHMTVQPGVASSIYEVVDIEEKDTAAMSFYGGRSAKRSEEKNPSKPVVVTAFTGKHVNLRVQKQDGKEDVDLLDALRSDGDSDDHEWPPTTGPRSTKPTRPTLNIFSVASGHLYERFLRMMFHTVMKSSSDVHGANTTRIKFWLIENFLSPHFKEFVPKMAQKYGFDFGFVTYRWPHWLRRQTEKQRTIWGYKILFLDVLFPLDVEKVIFVDADQVVRSDLHELYNMNLRGNAVAFTPFCQKNRNDETKGFRFWEQGFWADHLAGKPYHISAIYVVDLKRLRRMAAGDQYRMIYDNLSADPNSLANLDQDLPNFAQHQVPIFSLPEEWLWCATWCNEDSKAAAKTIDLCNNPLTKTPKLEVAKKIVPEWEEMDAALEKLFVE